MSFDPTIQGTKNYIEARDGTKLGLWTTYADAAGTSPVDGTGGSPASTFVDQTDSAIRKNTNFLWTKTAVNRQGEGFSYAFSIDNADKGKVLQCSFEYLIASGTYADNDMSVWIYDVTNAVLIQPAPYLIKNSGIIEKFAVEFQTSSNSTSYRLIIHTGSTSPLAYTVKFDNFMLGPQAKLYGSAITDWVSFTPTGSWTTNTTYTGRYRRIGDTAEFDINVLLSGAPNSATLTVNTPFTIDTAKGASNDLEIIGHFQTSDAGVASYEGFVQYNTPTNVICRVYGTASTYAGSNNLTQAVPITYGNLDNVHLIFRVPIVGWSSSQVFSQDADTRVVAALIGGGATSASSNNPIIYTTIGMDTHGAYSTSTGKYTVPVSGFYNVNATGDGTATAGTVYYVSVNGNTTAGYNRPIIAYQEVVNQGFSGAGKVYALAGQTIDIRATNNTGSFGTNATFQVERISGPSQIAASESVAASYTGAPPTGTIAASFNTVTFGTKVKDSHNAYSGGSYTVPTSGTYDISSMIKISGTYTTTSSLFISIFVDGIEVARSGYDSQTNTSTTETYPSINLKSYPLLAGKVITIRSYVNGVTSPIFASSALSNFFSITRTGNY